MNWAATRTTFCIIACMAVQACASVEQSAGDDAGSVAVTDQGDGIPRLPVFQPVSATVEEPPPQKRPTKKPPRRAQPKAVTEIARLPDPPAEDAAAPAVEVTAPKLVGLNEEQLEATLGRPTETQEILPGKLWRYRLPGCTVSVSLYPEVQTMIFRSLSYEVTSNDDTPDGIRACLSRRNESLVAK